MRLTLDEGKYEVISEEGKILVLRYGEVWRDFTGDKFMYLLLEEIEELKGRKIID